ncbi:MAG: hexapeptide transferase [Candidatus Brocadia sp. WS118]|nr:MAG: hexapeptide transferase [Candidatus Brocadia sp. WS118]
MKRLIYLGYYLRQLDRAKFLHFFQHARAISRKGAFGIIADVVQSSLKYNISILDYFYFRFFERDKADRATYAGTGFMYEYQLKMNPPFCRNILENKILFNQAYRQFIRRITFPLSAMQADETTANKLLENPSGKLVLKGATGQVGAEVKVVKTSAFTTDSLISFMETNHFDLAEEFVLQHPSLMQLSDTGLNTIRIFSQLDKNNEVVWLGARLRITVNSEVDNMAAGNLAAPIDIATGKVSGAAVYSDITKKEVGNHPITKAPIVGFQVPYWQKALQMVREAALLHPENRSIGWDVAITSEGPELIEGNHNWCKLLWQLPVKKGLKTELEKYL